MDEGQAGSAEPLGPGLDHDGLAEEHGRAEGDLDLGQDQALGSAGVALERLAGRRHPPSHAGRLHERQVDRVVDVAHRVGVGEPDLDARPMAEVAGQVARIRRAGDGNPGPRPWRPHGVTTRTPTIPASAWPGTEHTIA